MVVAVNLFELDGKIGANPYVAVGVDTHAGLASPPAVKACKPVKPATNRIDTGFDQFVQKVIREQFYYV